MCALHLLHKQNKNKLTMLNGGNHRKN
jgi:hypothetical protein